jgi:choline kinase
MTQAFCILAAGRGSRLGELTASINKALLPVDNKAAISHIIEKVPQDCEIVIAVGYDKEKLTEYCLAAHFDRSFVFVDVDKLDGPGSGPGYSLMCCEKHLQRPFYLCNVDTLIKDEQYPSLTSNWVGIDFAKDAMPFATVEYDVLTHNVIRLLDKGQKDLGMAYIGLMGIKDWEVFWERLTLAGTLEPEFQYIDALKSLYTTEGQAVYPGGISAKRFSWMDTGSVEGYQKAVNWFDMFHTETLGMEKNINELTYKVGDRLIKLCWDSEKNRKRLEKSNGLKGLIPNVFFHGTYVMAYIWEKGQTLYSVKDLGVWTRFLDWCQGNLWSHSFWTDFDLRHACHAFYHDKSWDRLRQFQTNKGWTDCPRLTINGHECQPIDSYLTTLNWTWLYQGRVTKIHGDLQFDNVVLTDRGEFKLIDWRECFATSVDMGDVYYDLAKLYMGLDLPYDVLKRKEVHLEWVGSAVTYELAISSTINSFKLSYEGWLKQHSYDVKKVRLLAALIQLNMAPLHPTPIGDVLYAHANLRLAQLK